MIENTHGTATLERYIEWLTASLYKMEDIKEYFENKHPEEIEETLLPYYKKLGKNALIMPNPSFSEYKEKDSILHHVKKIFPEDEVSIQEEPVVYKDRTYITIHLNSRHSRRMREIAYFTNKVSSWLSFISEKFPKTLNILDSTLNKIAKYLENPVEYAEREEIYMEVPFDLDQPTYNLNVLQNLKTIKIYIEYLASVYSHEIYTSLAEMTNERIRAYNERIENSQPATKALLENLIVSSEYADELQKDFLIDQSMDSVFYNLEHTLPEVLPSGISLNLYTKTNEETIRNEDWKIAPAIPRDIEIPGYTYQGTVDFRGHHKEDSEFLYNSKAPYAFSDNLHAALDEEVFLTAVKLGFEEYAEAANNTLKVLDEEDYKDRFILLKDGESIQLDLPLKEEEPREETEEEIEEIVEEVESTEDNGKQPTANFKVEMDYSSMKLHMICSENYEGKVMNYSSTTGDLSTWIKESIVAMIYDFSDYLPLPNLLLPVYKKGTSEITESIIL